MCKTEPRTKILKPCMGSLSFGWSCHTMGSIAVCCLYCPE